MKHFLQLFARKTLKSHAIPAPQNNHLGWPMWDRLNRWFTTLPENTKRKYCSAMKDFCRFAKIPETEDGAELFKRVTIDDVHQYVAHCQNKPAQPGRSKKNSRNGKVSMNTVKQTITALHCVYEELVRQGLVSVSPCEIHLKQLRKHKGRDRRPHRVIPQSKVTELLALNLEPYERAMIACLFGGALRRSEVLSLKICDVIEGDAGLLMLRLTTTKSQKMQMQVVLPEMAGFVREWHAFRAKESDYDEDPLFPQYFSGEPTDRAPNDRTLLRWFKAWMVKVGMSPDYSCHDARRTALNALIRAGLSIREVQEFGRHASLSATMGYLDSDQEKFLKAVASIKVFDSK